MRHMFRMSLTYSHICFFYVFDEPYGDEPNEP